MVILNACFKTITPSDSGPRMSTLDSTAGLRSVVDDDSASSLGINHLEVGE